MSPRLLRPILSGDPDALRYIAAVQQADQQSLEPAVRKAFTDFIVGCKQDHIWDALKASCILMGARTLSGAIVPLKGSGLTNNGPFVSGDYDRKTGLVGNGTTKYLTLSNPATPLQNSSHQSVYISGQVSAVLPNLMNHVAEWPSSGTNGRTQIATRNNQTFTRSRENTGSIFSDTSTSFVGISRSVSGSYTRRRAGANATVTAASNGVPSQTVFAFANPAVEQVSDGRLSWFSIGESLDIALLDTRVTALVNAIGAAIP
jgi:hypothetical protein